jgi:hypothetical protein
VKPHVPKICTTRRLIRPTVPRWFSGTMRS